MVAPKRFTHAIIPAEAKVYRDVALVTFKLTAGEQADKLAHAGECKCSTCQLIARYYAVALAAATLAADALENGSDALERLTELAREILEEGK